MMKFIGTKLKRFVTAFAEHFQMAQVTTSAAVLAYYTLLSIIRRSVGKINVV